jgi:hypothetical protein
MLLIWRHSTDLKKTTSQLGVEVMNPRFIIEDKTDFQDFFPDFYDLTAEIGIRAISCGELSKKVKI